MQIRFEQLSPSEAMKIYCNWLAEQLFAESCRRLEREQAGWSWYDTFYPLRTLVLGGRLLDESGYIASCIKYMDAFVAEQLPNGGFTAHYRGLPSVKLGMKEFRKIMREGCVNIADNGSNVTGLMQALPLLDAERRKTYIAAARKWFDGWVVTWILKEGCGNGIWGGRRYGTPYTMAMATLASALSAFGLATGEYEYIELAEEQMTFQMTQWLPDGRPINLTYFDAPAKTAIEDYARIFYLLEGMCWTHFASKNDGVKKNIADRMKHWIFSKKGILSKWSGSWFSFDKPGQPLDKWVLVRPDTKEELPSSQLGVRFTWEMAKANGLLHGLLYYLDNIEEEPSLRAKVDKGIKYLSHPLKARMSGVAAEPEESYGSHSIQATGFAGLSLAQAIRKNSVFEI